MISGFRCDVNEMCFLVGRYAASIGISLLMFQHFCFQGRRNPSRKWISWPLKLGPKGCPEISVRNYLSTLRNVPEEGISHRMLESLSSFTCVVESVASLVWDRRLPTICHPQFHHHFLWPTFLLPDNIFPLHRAKYSGPSSASLRLQIDFHVFCCLHHRAR